MLSSKPLGIEAVAVFAQKERVEKAVLIRIMGIANLSHKEDAKTLPAVPPKFFHKARRRG
jgi:hypothetical protein